MLGFADPWVGVAYILCVLSTILCIIYGIANWNKGEERVTRRDKTWAKEEEEIEEMI